MWVAEGNSDSESGMADSSDLRKRITSNSELLESAQPGRGLGAEFREDLWFVDPPLDCFAIGGLGRLESASEAFPLAGFSSVLVSTSESVLEWSVAFDIVSLSSVEAKEHLVGMFSSVAAVATALSVFDRLAGGIGS